MTCRANFQAKVSFVRIDDIPAGLSRSFMASPPHATFTQPARCAFDDRGDDGIHRKRRVHEGFERSISLLSTFAAEKRFDDVIYRASGVAGGGTSFADISQGLALDAAPNFG